MTKTYLATKDETIRAYKSLAEVGNACTESTSMINIFSAMATPSRLACTITNSSVYPGTSGTLTINKTGTNTGTATFVDATSCVSAGVFPWSGWQSSGYSNPNLLVNWDFREPVNQRGQSSYTEGGYCIDMWDNVGGSSIYLTDSGVRIVNNTNEEKWFTQKTEIKSNVFLTNAYTFSAKIDDTVYELALDGMQGGKAIKEKHISLYTNLSEEHAAFFFAIYPGCDVVISSVKLEMGPVSTLVRDIRQPSDYPAELRKCQRYLQVLDYHTNYYKAGVGYTVNTTTVNAFMPSVVPMRIVNPTISHTDASKWIIRCANEKIIPTEINVWYAGISILGFKFRGTFPAANVACVITYDTTDKLFISAEL